MNFISKITKYIVTNAIIRKGVSIIISNTLACLNERYLQAKMKNEESEIFLGVAYVEASEENNLNILPKNIIESNIFSGDLNKMNLGLKIAQKNIKSFNNNFSKRASIKILNDSITINIIKKKLRKKHSRITKFIQCIWMTVTIWKTSLK